MTGNPEPLLFMSLEDAVKHCKDVPGYELIQQAWNGFIRIPFHETAEIDFWRVRPGQVIFTMAPDIKIHGNPSGHVHGGVTETFLDAAMGCTIQTLLSANHGNVTLQQSNQFIRPITQDTGRIYATAFVDQITKSHAFGRAVVYDQNRVLLAQSLATHYIISFG